mmetsp:Transcript_12599/g.29582  ORF Transcript_12599/g.29582 Transcript_12599/m.29582 type:complete len:251 (+) Transcript_12599:138-890(+)
MQTFSGSRLHELDALRQHVYRDLDEVLVALRLRLGLLPAVAPHEGAVPPHDDAVRVGELLHGLLHRRREVALEVGIVDDGHDEGLVVAVRDLGRRLLDAFDHLHVGDLKRRGVLGEHHGNQHHVARVRVHAGGGVAEQVGVVEEGRAVGQLELVGVGAAGALEDLALVLGVEDEEVVGMDALLLDAAGGDESMASDRVLDGDAAAGAADPAEGVELAAELADELAGALLGGLAFGGDCDVSHCCLEKMMQ